MKKLLQVTVQTAVLLGLIWVILWTAEAIGNLLIALMPW